MPANDELQAVIAFTADISDLEKKLDSAGTLGEKIASNVKDSFEEAISKIGTVDIKGKIKVDKAAVNEIAADLQKAFDGGKIDLDLFKQLQSSLEGKKIDIAKSITVDNTDSIAQKAARKLASELNNQLAGIKIKIVNGENIDTSGLNEVKQKLRQALETGSISNTGGLSITKDIKKIEGEAQAGGASAGQKLGTALKSGLSAILATISLGGFVQGLLGAVAVAQQANRSSRNLSESVQKVNQDYKENSAILNDSKSTIEQRAFALGISVDKLYEDADASKIYAKEVQGLEANIRTQTRAFEDSNKGLEASIRGKEQEALALDRQGTAIDSQINQINREVQTKDRQVNQKGLEIQAIDRTITANERESQSIEAKIKKLDTEYNIKIRNLKLANGSTEIDGEITKLELSKNQLEIQRDLQDIQDKSTVLVQTSFESLLLTQQIDKIDLQLKLQKDKKDNIDLQVDALKKQEEIQKVELEIQKQGIDAQKLGFETQKDTLEIQVKQLETEKTLANFRKQDLEAQKQGIELTKAGLSQLINETRQQLESKKARFEIDITPAKRDLEDLQAKITALDSQLTKDRTLTTAGRGVADATSASLGVKPPSDAEIQGLAKNLGERYKNKLKETDISSALTNLVQSGVYDLEKVEGLFVGLAKKALEGNTTAQGFSESLVNITNAYKNNESEVAKQNGLQDNFTVILKKGTSAMIDNAKATKDTDIASKELLERYNDGKGVLSEQDLRYAKYLGTMNSVKTSSDNYKESIGQVSVTQEQLNKEVEDGITALDSIDIQVTKVQKEIGTALTPALMGLLKALTPVIDGFTDFVKNNAPLTRNIALLVAGFLGVATILGIVATAIFVFSNPFTILVGVIIGAVAVLGYLYKALDIAQSVNVLKDAFSELGRGIESIFSRLPDIMKSGIISALKFTLKLLNDQFTTANLLLDVFRKFPGFGFIPEIPKFSIPGFAKGGDFVVPPGFDNDSYLMRVQSGERVRVTPSNQVSGSYNSSTQNIQYNNYGNNSRGFMPQMLLQY